MNKSDKLQPNNSYLRHVGDIIFDSSIDDPDFTLCNGEDHIIQYFNNSLGFEYEGDKFAVLQEFDERFAPISTGTDLSGYVRIRFIVNCQGDIGRFRTMTSDLNYNQTILNPKIVQQLLSITQDLNGWQIKYSQEGHALDYYQHLIFRIHDGNIEEILP